MKPHCFGSAVIVSATSLTCQKCESASGCLATAGVTLDKLLDNEVAKRSRQDFAVTVRALTRAPQKFGRCEGAPTVVESTRGIKRITLTAREEAAIAALPPRVGSQVRQLKQRGWFDFARAELAAGRNPADKGWKRIMCALMLAAKHSRIDLQLAFEQQLHLTPASAKVQASIAMAVFTAGRLVRESEGRLIVSAN